MLSPKRLIRAFALGLVLALVAGLALAQDPQPQTATTAPAALGTAFTYQGRLEDAAGPVSGACDLRFKLFNAATGGTQIDGTQALPGVEVSQGFFTVQLDFGDGAFNGWPRWLEVEVRCPAGTGSYVKLSPRQSLTPSPYALYAAVAPDTLSALSCASGQVAKWNGSAWACGDDESGGGGRAYWSLTGNAGTSAAANYLGTSDKQPLELKVGGLRALRLEPVAASPNLIGGYGGNQLTPGVAGGTIGGGGSSGYLQKVTDHYGVVGGGGYNQAGDGNSKVDDATYATVAGGWHNVASGASSAVGGGYDNVASGEKAAVAGGVGNDATAYGATVGGGLGNQATGDFATVGGGGRSDAGKPETANRATGEYATIGGGTNNLAAGYFGTIGGGKDNQVTRVTGTVGGGSNNLAGDTATVGGGYHNEASGSLATIGGGSLNRATAYSATIPGGLDNTASGDYSFAAGYRARAKHKGAFVWADASGFFAESTRDNQFLVRAGGGVRVTGASNPAPMLWVTQDGTNDALYVAEYGSKRAGFIGIGNAANGSHALEVTTDGGGHGLHASTSGTYAGYFEDKIYVQSGCVNCAMAYVALNTGTQPLEPGDLVAASGVSQPLAGTDTPVMHVQEAAARSASGVVGVVQGRARLVEGETGGAPLQTAEAAEGAAAPGDYLFVVVQGITYAKADPAADEISAGQRLTVAAAAGQARALETRTLDGMAITEGAPVVGVALGPADPATGLVPVLVTLR